MRITLLVFSVLLFGCELKEQRNFKPVPKGSVEWINSKGETRYTTAEDAPPKRQFEETNSQPVSPPVPPEPPTIKGKPTWDTRGLTSWNKSVCDSQGRCTPNGHATMLVEFTHLGCRPFKQFIDDRSALIYGYAPEHQFILVIAATDALTRELFDYPKPRELPCYAFLYDDTPKSDKTPKNEDQLFVALCKDATSVDDGECRSQLSDKRLYAP